MTHTDEDPRFWQAHWNEVQEEGLQASIAAGDVIAIVDEEVGGIIAYALATHADRIVNALNPSTKESK